MAKDHRKAPTHTALVRENERLKFELKAIRGSRIASNVGLIGKEAVKWAGIVLTVWLGAGQIAGKTTQFDFDAAIDVCGSLTDALKELAPGWIVQLASLLVVTAVLVANRRLRRLNNSQSTRLGELTQTYEVAHDARRSSSGLGRNGETHERDET